MARSFESKIKLLMINNEDAKSKKTENFTLTRLPSVSEPTTPILWVKLKSISSLP